jgi:pSer/pThr/pTyr-binding forkhead associated (FHA) protein
MTTPRPRPAIVPPWGVDAQSDSGPGRLRCARLIVFRDGAVHRALELGSRALTIGRGLQNDLVLEDPDRTVSRFHAEVRQERGGWVLLDLNSQNGTWVESRRVDRVELRAGVPVMIGRYRLVFDDTPIGA